MNRRNFISLSSTSFAAVMFDRLTTPSLQSKDIINSPEQVSVLLDTGWVKLMPSGINHFRYQNTEVLLQHAREGLSVSMDSPSLSVKSIRLDWQHSTGADTKSLGDNWERTYGDLHWSSRGQTQKSPWYLILHDENMTTCFGVKTGSNSFCAWELKQKTLILTIDTRSAGTGVRLGGRRLHAAEIITTKSLASENTFQTSQRFCGLMCEKPRLPAMPVYGINDWYYAYGNNSAELILKQTSLMGEMITDPDNKPFSVIDAGWAAYAPQLAGDCCWGDDFSKPNDKFEDMHAMADQLKKTGMRPGIWTRPLCANHTDAAHLLLPKIPGRDDARKPVLDPTIEENIEKIKYNIALYKQWGFEMVKHDFTSFDITGRWGFQMNENLTEEGWRFYDDSRTTAEIVNHLYETIRDAADDMYLIGCNTFSHLSAGLFELNRIGDDTSGKEWDRTRKMGVNTLGFRIIQHKTFYSADADCVGLTTAVPWGKNKQWMQLLAGSSTPLFISAQPEAIGAEQRAFIKTCFAQAAKPQPTGEPLDWLDHSLPVVWKLNNQKINFNWE